MAAGTTEVLQEYLVKLGYTIDTVSQKRLTDGLSATGKRVMDVGKGVAGVVVAVEAATAAFAYSMRKAYFAADLAGTSMKKMEAASYASKQIGISSEAMASAIQSMAMNLRMNPGLKAYVESFGIKVTGRDISDVMLDMVAATKQFPEFTGAQIMGQFGMSAEQYHLLRENADKFKAAQEESLNIQREMNVDMDAATTATDEYTKALDKLGHQLSMSGKTASIGLFPMFTAITGWVSSGIEGLNDMMNATREAGRQAGRDAKRMEQDRLNQIYKSQGHAGRAASSPTQRGAGAVMQKLMDMGWRKEEAAGITANLHFESKFDPMAEGDYDPKSGQYQAYGIAQWHPERQADFKKWAGKDIRESTFDEQLAFLTYEMTKGKYARIGKALHGVSSGGEAGSLVSKGYEIPKDVEGQAALRSAMAAKLGGDNAGSTTISQTNNITVNGATKSDADAVSKAIVRETSRELADITRNMGRNQQ